MTTELTALGWAIVLALVQVLLHAGARTRETGLQYNAGARDQVGPQEGAVTGRLRRARDNLYESLPLFAAVVLIAHLAGRENGTTAAAAWTFLAARVIYVPLYALGVPMVRTLVWGVSLLAIVAYLWVILRP